MGLSRTAQAGGFVSCPPQRSKDKYSNTHETISAATEWKEYEFRVDTSGTVPLGGQKSSLTGTVPSDMLKVISVTFANDGSNPVKNEDRNLYVGGVRIMKDE